MITVSEVTKGFGGRVLFKDVSVAFSSGNNYGLTGPNGSGKSTFMKILLGQEDTDAGSISLPRRVGWLRQEQSAFDDQKVIDTVIMGNTRLWEALVERERLYDKGDDLTEDEGVMLGELEGVVAEEDGYEAEANAATLLAGLGVDPALHDRPMAEVPAGEKVRVLLAQSLFGDPEALLLDEPTNGLDMDSIIWLEEFLIDYNGVLIVISHDRRFLNQVCDHIADIDYETIIIYPGNYDGMVRQKANVRSRVEKENAAREKKISQLQDFISKFGAGTRASQTRSRAKQIEKLRPEEIKRSNIARPYIRFSAEPPSGRDVLRVEGLSHAYGDHLIFDGVPRRRPAGREGGDPRPQRGRQDHPAPGAAGDQDNHDQGRVRWGHNTSIGVMGHDHRDQIEPGLTVYSWLFAQRPEVGEQQVRAILGRMLFSNAGRGEAHRHPVGGRGRPPGDEQPHPARSSTSWCSTSRPITSISRRAAALRDAIDGLRGDRAVRDPRSGSGQRSPPRSGPTPSEGELINYEGTLDEYLDWHSKYYSKAS